MVKSSDITIAICAFNAENTIERAVKSALAASSGPILLVDDCSTDQTAVVAARIGGSRLQITQPLEKVGIGNARQTALETINTPYGIWLDADDEMLPDRSLAMRRSFEKTDADLVFGAAELIDGVSGKTTAHLQMPDFLNGPGIWHLFERNWLPGLWGGFKVSFARKIGYDLKFFNSEDYDFTLRALVAGAKISLTQKCGYRYYHYGNSVSRNLKEATNFTNQALGKHRLQDINALMHAAGVSDASRIYLGASLALLTGQYSACIAALDAVKGMDQHVEPYGASAASLTSFLAGVSHLKQREANAALAQFSACGMASADCINNIGVCYLLLADHGKARRCFGKALELSPGYVDARQNLKQLGTDAAPHITLLPLRPLVGRSTYDSPVG